MLPNDTIIEVRGLMTQFFTDEGVVNSVDGAGFRLDRRKTLCLVGESGSGKSVTARSILQIVDKPGRIVGGEILFRRPSGDVLDLAKIDPRAKIMREIRGKEIGMIFQEPMAALSPVHTIGDQIMEAILLHFPISVDEAKKRAIEMLDQVGIPQAASRLDAYSFQLSGGMRQRAMIAMALSCRPSLLIADEPTTALDVTTQANILELIIDLQKSMDMSLIFITHDLGVVAEIADDVAVMYLGKVIEQGDVYSIFENPLHPYTQALLKSVPRFDRTRRRNLESLPGMVPHPLARPSGCCFHTRCGQIIPGVCDTFIPPRVSVSGDRMVSCFLHERPNEDDSLGQGPFEGAAP